MSPVVSKRTFLNFFIPRAGYALAMAAVIPAASLSFLSVEPVEAQQGVKIRAGGPISLLYLPYYIALEEGYFKKRNIEIDNIQTLNYVPALISGELDFAMGGSDSTVIAADKGKPIPAVVMMQYRNSLSISAGTNLALPNAKKGYPENMLDLKGKTVGVPNRGTGAESLVKQALAAKNLEEGRDYSMVVVGGGASLMTALKAGTIDAALLWPPFAEQAWADKIAVPLVREAMDEGPETRQKGAGIPVAANVDFLKAQPEAAKRFIAAIVEADEFNRDFAKNKERLIDIASKYTGLTDRGVLASAIESQSKLAFPGADCDAWKQAAIGLLAIKSISQLPKCSDMVAMDVAPPGPLPGQR